MAKRRGTEMETLRKEFGLSETQAKFCWAYYCRKKAPRRKNGTTDAELYTQAGGSANPKSAAAAASRAVNLDKFQRALAWLRAPGIKKAKDRRAGQIRRLEARAKLDFKDVVEVGELQPDRARIIEIALAKELNDEHAFKQLRSMLYEIRLKPLEEMPRRVRQAVKEISHDARGNLQLKFESRSEAERQLAKNEGWEATTVVTIEQGIQEALSEILTIVAKVDPECAARAGEIVARAAEERKK